MSRQLIATNNISGGFAAAEVIDVFGTPGARPGLGQIGNFDDGKAVRKSYVSAGKSVFDETEWDVYGDSATPQNVADMDPRVWAGAGSSPTSPSPTALSINTSSPSAVTASVDGPNLLITEVADPKDSYQSRFVELYSNNGAGQAVGQYNGKDVYLTLTSNTNVDFNGSVLLTGTAIGSDGFLVLCSSTSVFSTSYNTSSCDLASSSVINSNGDDSYAVSCCKVS